MSIKAKLVSMCWSQGALLDLYLLESSSREEKCWVGQGFVRVDQLSSSSEDMPKMGEHHVDLHQAKRNQERWCVLRR